MISSKVDTLEQKSHNSEASLKLLPQVSSKKVEYLVPDTKNIKVFERYIGKTPLIRCNNIAPYLSCERLYAKFEGSNPTGTQKDRIAFALAKSALSSGYSAITTASCGNFGVSLAFFGKIMKLDTYIFIPENYHVPKERLDRMYLYQATIIYVPGTYEDAVELSRQYALELGYFDANPGGEVNAEISIRAYSTIAHEIQSHLRRTPDYIVCPVGNGTTLAGIYQGYAHLQKLGKIKDIPRIIASGTPRGNPIIQAFKSGQHTITDLNPQYIRETRVNEPLTNWHSFDGQQALDSIYNSHGYAEYASDHQMLKISKLLLREEGICALPASASSLAIIPKMYESGDYIFERKNNLLKGTFVTILTSRYGG